MRFRGRREERDDRQRSGSGPTGSDGANTGGDLRRVGEGFLAAGSEAIRRALSDDSEAFLDAVQQEGGQ